MEGYKHSRSSVGSNKKHVQITPKYRHKMMRKDKLRVFCKVAIEEACKRHNIEIDIIKVMPEHVHILVNCPRTMTDVKMMQLIKGLSAYLLFRICPNLRKRFPRGHFWTCGYFCDSVGSSDYESTYKYIENQDLHHN
jgi:putative transposase